MAGESDDKVGYGCPPKSGQFKKGRSGNPRGRPKKVKGHLFQMRREDVDDTFLFSMKKDFTYTENGEVKRNPFIIAFYEKLKIDAMKGDKFAKQEILKRMDLILDQKFQAKLKFLQWMVDNDCGSDEFREKLYNDM